MSTPDITFGVLDGTQAGDHADQLQALHAEVRAGPAVARPEACAARFADRFRVQRRQPGYVLAVARHGEYLVGYASGFPLRPSTSWWRHLTTALPEEVTAEHPGRTFALCELLVRAPWRRQGIGAALHDLVLRGRRSVPRSPSRPPPPRRRPRSGPGAGARSPARGRPVPAHPSATCSSAPFPWRADPRPLSRGGLSPAAERPAPVPVAG